MEIQQSRERKVVEPTRQSPSYHQQYQQQEPIEDLGDDIDLATGLVDNLTVVDDTVDSDDTLLDNNVNEVITAADDSTTMMPKLAPGRPVFQQVSGNAAVLHRNKHILTERRSSSPRFLYLPSEQTPEEPPAKDEFEEFRQRAMSLPHRKLQPSKSSSFRKRRQNKSPRTDEVYVREVINTPNGEGTNGARLAAPQDPGKKVPIRGSPENREYENNRRLSSQSIKYLESPYRNRALTLPYLPDSAKIHHWRYNPEDAEDESPKSPSVVEQRFRQLPESAEYEKIRTFDVNEKGEIEPTVKGYCYRPKADSSLSPTSGRSSPGSVPPSPVSITAEGVENILSATGVKRYVILIIGADNVGKSSLITQLLSCSDSVDIDRCDTINAESKNVMPVLISGKEVDLFFIEWDAFEKRPWKLRIYCAAIIVMYSVISKTTFSTAADVLYQLREHYSDDVPIILVANKIDLARQRCIETHDGKELAKSYNCKFVEVSVLLAHQTDELLKQLLIDLRKVDKKGSIIFTGKLNRTDSKKRKYKPIIAVKQRANSMYHSDREAETLRQRLARSCEDLFAKLWK